ncbi:hypothetical protein N8T08_002903 [Aspergillus melleus]|uniref:Uncharacterized protein n=1 Tax=Aspergillus melleus TaxID=138277 RepID=A0ACC3B809_9EURO|nr:hypothetical protein N8T08_002903 [Aspergillus melleus]
MKDPFKKVHVCSFGHFGGDGDKIPQWVKAHGGQYSKNVSQGVTHLITTMEAFKKNVETVRKAKRFKIKIVSYDWLEDSLLSKSRAPKREGPYLLETILKNEKKASAEAKAKKAPKRQIKVKAKRTVKSKDPFATGFGTIKKGAAATDYHLYTDNKGVIYNAALTRPTIQATREKYQLKIFELTSNPNTYATHVKYTRTGKSTTELKAPIGSTLHDAMSAFEQFFEEQIGKKWADRLDGVAPERKRDDDGNVLPISGGWFHYEQNNSILSNFLREPPRAVEPTVSTSDNGADDREDAESQAEVLDQLIEGDDGNV